MHACVRTGLQGRGSGGQAACVNRQRGGTREASPQRQGVCQGRRAHVTAGAGRHCCIARRPEACASAQRGWLRAADWPDVLPPAVTAGRARRVLCLVLPAARARRPAARQQQQRRRQQQTLAATARRRPPPVVLPRAERHQGLQQRQQQQPAAVALQPCGSPWCPWQHRRGKRRCRRQLQLQLQQQATRQRQRQLSRRSVACCQLSAWRPHRLHQVREACQIGLLPALAARAVAVALLLMAWCRLLLAPRAGAPASSAASRQQRPGGAVSGGFKRPGLSKPGGAAVAAAGGGGGGAPSSGGLSGLGGGAAARPGGGGKMLGAGGGGYRIAGLRRPGSAKPRTAAP